MLSQHYGCISSCDFAKDGELLGDHSLRIQPHLHSTTSGPDSIFVSAGYDTNVNIWCSDTSSTSRFSVLSRVEMLQLPDRVSRAMLQPWCDR